ncbi:MAG: TIGR02757 family protein [Chitinophagaceae bacterium]
MAAASLKKFLDKKVDTYNQPFFIKSDPICVPHQFTRLQDIEIAGFFASIFAWGNRTTIIQKSRELMALMDNEPYLFCLQHEPDQLRRLLAFKHRTFNATDLLYFIQFLHHHYQQEESLQSAFTRHGSSVEEMLTGFHQYFFSLEDAPERTRKHIASPARGSTCKRLNMFLRWMVRRDDHGVDFGLWTGIDPSQLICPIDLHVARVARGLQLLKRAQTDWIAAIELTTALRKFDKKDPVKYDFALFAMGVSEKH